MILATRRTDYAPLTAVQIFWNFARDTLVTGGIYTLFILVTLALKYFSRSLETSPIHYAVVVGLEYAIFISGSLVVLLILVYVTTVSIFELGKSFECALSRIRASSGSVSPAAESGSTAETVID